MIVAFSSASRSLSSALEAIDPTKRPQQKKRVTVAHAAQHEETLPHVQKPICVDCSVEEEAVGGVSLAMVSCKPVVAAHAVCQDFGRI